MYMCMRGVLLVSNSYVGSGVLGMGIVMHVLRLLDEGCVV